MQLVNYSRFRSVFPEGLVVAGVHVGGLDRQSAAARLLEAYALPVELYFNEALVHLDPATVGFELDIDRMLAAADLQRTAQPFWEGFWDFLWARQQAPGIVPLDWTYSEERLRAYLSAELSPRYDQPATPALPAVGTVNFIPGVPGLTLDVDDAILPIENALTSITNRTVILPVQRTDPNRLAFSNLERFLTQSIDRAAFDGLTGVYLLDLQTAQEIHFVYQQGDFLSTQPDVAFTAASIVKVPIMVSIFQRYEGEPDEATIRLLEEMIELSGNDPADWVMQRVIDATLGPLAVTEDMQALGLESTFLAGHFYLGAPLLVRYDTPANQRDDVYTNPDPFNQTTASDMGMLLADIYQCAQRGGGSLRAVFPESVTQEECQMMLTFLTRNHLASLLTAGTPDGTQIAHKHGWVTNGAGVINAIGDAGIIYTPAGNYVMVVFLYHPEQLIWDASSALIAELSRSVYNYYNQQ